MRPPVVVPLLPRLDQVPELRISFTRRVGRAASIELPGGPYRVGRRLAGRYVVATLYTHRREIVVKLAGRVVKRFPCPMRE